MQIDKSNLFFTAHRQKQIKEMKPFHKDIILFSSVSKSQYINFDETLRFLRQLPKKFYGNRVSSKAMSITCNIIIFRIKIDFNTKTSFILFSCLCSHILLDAIPFDTAHFMYCFNIPLNLQVLPIEQPHTKHPFRVFGKLI